MRQQAGVMLKYTENSTNSVEKTYILLEMGLE